MVTFSMTFTVP